MQIGNGTLLNGDCLELMRQIPDGSVDMVVTSPPYDNLRTYNDSLVWNFDIFKSIAKELTRVLKSGGVIVWNVADATVDGSETGTSFRQALHFKDVCGLNLHDPNSVPSYSGGDVRHVLQAHGWVYEEYLTMHGKGLRS